MQQWHGVAERTNQLHHEQTMAFCFESIGPTEEPTQMLGRIEIDAFAEHFWIDVSFWDVATYEKQWRSGVRRLIDGATSSCVIQSMSNPTTSAFLFWWPMYRLSGDVVAVQNQILFFDQLDRPFDPTDPYRFVGARSSAADDGRKISEWQTTLGDLRAFERTRRRVHGHST